MLAFLPTCFLQLSPDWPFLDVWIYLANLLWPGHPWRLVTAKEVLVVLQAGFGEIFWTAKGWTPLLSECSLCMIILSQFCTCLMKYMFMKSLLTFSLMRKLGLSSAELGDRRHKRDYPKAIRTNCLLIMSCDTGFLKCCSRNKSLKLCRPAKFPGGGRS